MIRPVVILGSIALLGAGLWPAEASAKGGVTFRATADAYVSAKAPRANFGRARILRAGGGARTYLRFDVAGLDAPVSAAVLRVFVRSKARLTAWSTSSGWSERRITFRNAPRPVGAAGRSSSRTFRWVALNVQRLVKGNGSVSFVLTGSGRITSREAGANAPQLIVTATAPTLIAAGDVGYCGTQFDEATGALIKGMRGTVAALGDLAYEHGSAAEFAACYQPSWGAFKNRTWPTPGNHEYETDPTASGYFGYWGIRAGNPTQGWYSYNLGAWHLISLNSNCAFVGGCGLGSPQETWLRSDLAAHKAHCTLAYWHHPRFSGGQVTSDAMTQQLWQDLYDANADLVLTGHAHNYQRFAPQNAGGAADPVRGIREFVVGTGGNPTLHPVAAVPNTEVVNSDTWGVLQLSLRNSGYDWHFVRAAGGSFTDPGSTSCH
jgi:hypothetical protein